MAVAHATLGDDIICKMLDLAHIALQHGDFQAVVMVDVHMQRGNGKVVMVMLSRHDAARQVALLMFVNIGEHRVAVGLRLDGSLFGKGIAQNIPDGFRAIIVAPALT